MKEAELGEDARAGSERKLNTKVWGGQKVTRESQDRIGLGDGSGRYNNWRGEENKDRIRF